MHRPWNYLVILTLSLGAALAFPLECRAAGTMSTNHRPHSRSHSRSDSAEEPPAPDCSVFNELLTYHYGENDPYCEQQFGDLHRFLFVTHNACQRLNHRPEVNCTLRDGWSQRTIDQISELATRAAENPRGLQERIIRRYGEIDNTPIRRCVRDTAGQPVEPGHFKDLLLPVLQVNTEVAHTTLDASGRRSRRPERWIPFRSMSRETKQLISVLIGGLADAIRGGRFIHFGSTQTARATYGLLMGAVGTLNGGIVGGLAGASTALPLMMIGWSNNMDIGRNGGSALGDTAMMSLYGTAMAAPAAIIMGLGGYNPTYSLLGGAARGPCYALAWQASETFRVRFSSNSTSFDGPTSIGEACGGAAFALGFSSDLLNGSSHDI